MNEHTDKKVKIQGIAIGATVSGVAGIPICLLEQLLFQWHFWVSFTGYAIGIFIVTPVVLTLYWNRSGETALRELPSAQHNAPQSYQLGEALLLSEHLMACKMHEGVCLCCHQRIVYGSVWIYLFVVREQSIHSINQHRLDIWDEEMKRYGTTIAGWIPAERMLPESVLQKIAAHPGNE